MSNSHIPAQKVDCVETPCAEETAYLCAVESPIPNSFSFMFPFHIFQIFLLILFLIAVLLIVFWTNILLTPISLMKLWLLDGSLAGTITHASTISVKFPCETLLQIQFLLTKLDCDFPAVLGLDWLTLHNLLIDWVRHSVTF